jgi:nucleotide-binding universal stress UspA family protein
MTHDRILIATDDSEPAKKAIGEAITLANAFDATLYAVYVVETAEPRPGVTDSATGSDEDTKADQALQRVISEAEEHGLEGEVVSAVVRGQPASAILQHANEQNIDLIVVGTHGRKGIDRLVVGSVAERVIRDSPVPVVTISMND